MTVDVFPVCRRKMEEAFEAESVDYEPAFKSKGRVNGDNWDSLIGVDHPPPGPPDFSKPKAATHYNDFVEFFTEEIAAKGAKPVIEMVCSAYLASIILCTNHGGRSAAVCVNCCRSRQKCVMALLEISHMPSSN